MNTETTPGRLHDHDEPPRKKFRYDPTINAGHVLSGLFGLSSAVVFAVSVYSTLDKRIVTLEEARKYEEVIAARERANVEKKFDDIKSQTEKIQAAISDLRVDVKGAQRP
jgi:hypothetical protein